MAPSPEHDKEPKAPDKTDNTTSDPTTNEISEISCNSTIDTIPSEQNTTSTTTTTTSSSSAITAIVGVVSECDVQESSSVSTLDDVQLKSLLDEAINYKTPKDREGKSQIFKELLQEAEEDERNARAASASGPQLARYYNTAAIGAARRHRQNNRNNRESSNASATHHQHHGGSLQDLAQSDLYADAHNVSGGHSSGGRKAGGGRRHRQITGQKSVSVSARQREGGSLPSNVNAGARNLLFDDDYVRKDEPCLLKSIEIESSKPEYTIIELGSASSDPPENKTKNNNNKSAEFVESADETSSLLMKETRNYSTLESVGAAGASGNSSDVNVPKYRYPLGDLETCAAEEDPVPSPPVTIPTTNNNKPVSHVSRHQYFNPLEEYNKLPRIKYTSMAKVEIDSTATAVVNQHNQQVDKGISFSQFTNNDDGNAEFNSSVRCIVDPETSGGTIGTASTTTTTTTTVVSSVSGRAHTLTKLSSDYRLLALPTNTKAMERFKGLDENGNHQTATPQLNNNNSTTNSSAFDPTKKKMKKSKVDRNVCVLDAKDIAGHQADIISDIDQLVKYIEENDDTNSKTPKKHLNHKLFNYSIDVTTASTTPAPSVTSAINKKPKRMKTKSETGTPKSALKKSNSLEEVSKTKFTDLMSSNNKRSRVKKQSTSEDGDNPKIQNSKDKKDEIRDRRSWGTEDSQQYMLSKHQRETSLINSVIPVVSDPQIINQESADFHVVTKKKKSKNKRTARYSDDRSNNQHERFNYHYHKIENNQASYNSHYNARGEKDTNKTTNSHHPHHHRNAFSGENSVPTRRKSACSVPPSDKSGESSDVDSVHSLPTTTTSRRQQQQKQQINNNSAENKEFNDTLAALCATNNGNNSPPGSTTSYADIARNNNIINIQQQLGGQQQKSTIVALQSSEHFPELESPPTTTKITEEFPTLTLTLTDEPISVPIPIPIINKSSRNKQSPISSSSSVVNKTSDNVRPPPSKTLTTTRRIVSVSPVVNTNVNTNNVNRGSGSGRPAVIILNDSPSKLDDLSFVQQSPSEPIQVSGLTFGFELNEQLLNDDELQEPKEEHQPEQQPELINICDRFLAPPCDVKENYNHDKIVQFIGLAWEESIHDNKGKTQYYNGQ